MSTRIHIIHRIIRTVHIQMQRIRFHIFSTIRILRQEPTIFRIIESGVIVIQPRLFIIHLSGIANLIIKAFPYPSGRIPEFIIFISRSCCSAIINQTGCASSSILVVQIPGFTASGASGCCDYIVFPAQQVETVSLFLLVLISIIFHSSK